MLQNQISLEDANALEKQVGAWIWDGLLYHGDSIVNPMLQILGNEAGRRIRAILSEQ